MLGSTTKQNEIEKATKEQDEKYTNLQATIEKECAKIAEESAISPISPGQINAEKKDWRDAEIDKTEDNKKFLENKITDTKTAMDDAKGSISTFNTEIEVYCFQSTTLSLAHPTMRYSTVGLRTIKCCFLRAIHGIEGRRREARD